MHNNYIPIVLCAGFGTRLQPLSNFIPKVVCPIGDKPFAFFNIEQLLNFGFQTVHCNVHYLSDLVKVQLYEACSLFGYNCNRIRFWDEADILESGGGITRIFQQLCVEDSKNKNKDLLVVSGDIIAHFPITAMLERWEQRQGDEEAMLCTKNLSVPRPDVTYVNANSKYIEGFGRTFIDNNITKNFIAKLFTNHQIISAKFVQQLSVCKKSSIDLFYCNILNRGKKIINFNYLDTWHWFNVGSVAEYLECLCYFNKNNKDLFINYISILPKNLLLKIEEYLNNNFIFQEISKDNKIIIAFKSYQPFNYSRYLSLKKLCAGNYQDDDIYVLI